MKVTQFAQASASTTAFHPAYQVRQTLEPENARICDLDGKGVTGLRWIEDVKKRVSLLLEDVLQSNSALTFDVPPQQFVLIYCKPGTVHLWADQTSSNVWSGSREFKLWTQRLSVSSSSLSLLSGVEYIKRLDIVVLTLSDGSFHAIHGISNNPSLQAQTNDLDMISESLSRAARSVILQIDNEASSAQDVNCINGMLCYDNAATFTWIHE